MIAINVVVDPFRVFGFGGMAGINKERLAFEARMTKAEIVCRRQPQTTILGTSRVEVGIDPTHPAFTVGPGPVYNAGLAGAGIHELDLMLRHVVHASPARPRVLLGLDFLMFNAHREAVVFGTEVFGFDQGRLLQDSSDNCFRAFLFDIGRLLGPKALYYSLQTILGQMDERSVNATNLMQWISIYDRDGFRRNFRILDQVRTPIGGYRALFGIGQELGYARKVWRPPPTGRYCFETKTQPNTLEVFRGMVRFAYANGVDLKVFINPVHARLIIALHEVGLWPIYEDWKRGLVQVMAKEAEIRGVPQFPLWDFSGFNSVTTEPVPPEGDVTTKMRWFWEPAHYKKEAGDLILDRILGYRDSSRHLPEDFGILLTPATIDGWLDKSRMLLHEYEQREPGEAALVRNVVDEVMAGAEGANCGEDIKALRKSIATRKQGDTATAEAQFARALALHEAERARYAALDAPFRESGFTELAKKANARFRTRPTPDFRESAVGSSQ